MTMKHVGDINLPEHCAEGGFDHADIHMPSNRLYVAHTGNNAVDVIDTVRLRCRCADRA